MLTENQVLTLVNCATGATDLLEQILTRQPTAAERFAEEERRAWDRYRAHWMTHAPDEDAERYADRALAERRKRFPTRAAESPDGDSVPVQRSLLKAIVAVGKTEGLEGLRPLLAQLGEALK